MSPLKKIKDDPLYEEMEDRMQHLKNKSMEEPKKPDMYGMSPKQQLEALLIYKRDRNRWLKQLKHIKSGSISVDYSLAAHKQQRKTRTMKDSQWKAEQENRIYNS